MLCPDKAEQRRLMSTEFLETLPQPVAYQPSGLKFHLKHISSKHSKPLASSFFGLPHHFFVIFTCYVTILIDLRVSDPKNIPRKNTLISKSSKVIFNLNRAFVKFLVLLNNLNVTRAQIGYLNNLEQLKKTCMNKNRKQESTSHS
jgi:hypothetical protein